MSWLTTQPLASDTRSPGLSESLITRIVAAGGGRYVGLLDESDGWRETLVLFASLRTRSTLALPLSRLCVRAVRARIAKSDRLFARFAARRQNRGMRAA